MGPLKVSSNRAKTATKAQLQAERDFLLARTDAANVYRPDHRPRWTGTSSNALVRYAFGGDAPASGEYPMDPSDLAACYRTVWRLPDHLRPRDGWVADMLHRYRVAVESRYDLHELDAALAKETQYNEVNT